MTIRAVSQPVSITVTGHMTGNQTILLLQRTEFSLFSTFTAC